MFCILEMRQPSQIWPVTYNKKCYFCNWGDAQMQKHSLKSFILVWKVQTIFLNIHIFIGRHTFTNLWILFYVLTNCAVGKKIPKCTQSDLCKWKTIFVNKANFYTVRKGFLNSVCKTFLHYIHLHHCIHFAEAFIQSDLLHCWLHAPPNKQDHVQCYSEEGFFLNYTSSVTERA